MWLKSVPNKHSALQSQRLSPFSPPPQNDIEHPTYDSALSTLRADPVLSPLFKTDSWQEKMVAQCQSALHTKPHRAKAVLFYSQHPDGRKDIRSKHGGCPVLNDEEGKNPKWAANLWVWNAARFGYKEAPTKANYDPDNKRAKAARKSKLKDVSARADEFTRRRPHV